MAPPKKRELDVDTPSAKRQKKSQQQQQSKPAKPAQSEKKDVSTSKEADPASAKPKSILKAEERIFPRGGGSVLTPQELKQVHLQAKQDVLFEQGLSKQKSSKSAGDGDDDSNDEFGPEPTAKKGKSKDKKLKGKKNKKGDKSKESNLDGPVLRPEGLSFKRLVEGSIVLGQVTQVTRRDVCLAIPNNLSGYVPLAGVSQQFTAKIEKALADSDDESDSDSDDEPEDIVLHLDRYFRVGQTLRAYVNSTEDGDGVLSSKTKRHIELSLEPKLVNGELKKSDLHVGCMIQASVVSVEDHGLVMDLGLQDSSSHAFLPIAELEEGVAAESIHEGAVMLCQVTAAGKGGEGVKLTANHTRGGDVSKIKYVTSSPSIKSVLPGTPVELLVTDTSGNGVVGKIMGMLDATADFIHSGGPALGETDIEDKFSIGDRVHARVICTFPNADTAKVGVSLLPHVLSLKPISSPFKHSEFVEGTVSGLPTKSGLFLKYNDQPVRGFVHVSRVHDKKIGALATESAYKSGTTHKSRVIGFNPIDGLVIAALDAKTLEQPFLTIQDVPVAQVVDGKIAKLLIKNGKVSGILVTLAEGIVGFVPEMHFADVQLTHPEKRFREGQSVRAIVLSVDVFRRRIRLSLKKSLVNSDGAKFTDLSTISPGDQAPGTLIKVFPTGAIVKFFGSVRGFLPVAEMSEGFVTDAREHFRTGQSVNVHVLRVDAAQKQLIVSCRDPNAFGFDKADAFEQLKLGGLVSGTITELAADSLVLQLGDGAAKGLLDLSHLTDRSAKRNAATLKKLRVGQTLSELVVLMKNSRRNTATVSLKPSLIAASQAGELALTTADLVEGKSSAGYVRGVSTDGVFVQFGSNVVGLVHRTQLPQGAIKETNFGFFRGQSVTPRVLSIDDQGRVQLSLKPVEETQKKDADASQSEAAVKPIVNPVDDELRSAADLHFGRVVKASVTSVKQTQLNVRIADGIQGRVDVSEAFASVSQISNRKAPLDVFTKGQIISARIIGIHDSRTHRFLPLSHRSGGKVPVFEMSIRGADDASATISDLASVSVGSTYPVFVNNFASTNVWVSLSAAVRGSIDILRLSDDVARLQQPAEHFPLGSVLEATVTAVNPETHRLDLAVIPSPSISIDSLSTGTLLVGRVGKVTPRALLVQISDSVSGLVPLTELADNFDSASTASFERNDIVRVAVVHVDKVDSKIILSTRPSHVLSSQSAVTDRHISSVNQISANDIVRGFVSRIGSKGISISLGPSATGFAHVSSLSDDFFKGTEWQKSYEIGQLVKARVLSVDPQTDRAQLSLKASVLKDGYLPPITFESLKVGQVLPGTIRKVEDYGVFVVLDNSKNVSGLCHKSMLADDSVKSVSALYDAGDRVKAKVVSIDKERRRANFGLKASLFTDDEMNADDQAGDGDVDMDAGVEESGDDSDEEMGGVALGDSVDSSDESGGEQDSDDSEGEDKDEDGSGSESEDSDSDSDSDAEAPAFDWTGESVAAPKPSTSAPEVAAKKSKSKSAITVDMTGSLDATGPQSTADFERLLLAETNSSTLWIQYMAFFAQLGEIDQARAIANRALSSIHMRETDEKMNVWIALLNLENAFGDESSLKETFGESCKFNDSATMHEKMVSILIECGKVDRARELFGTMTKIRALSATPAFWINYASFLMKTCNDANAARALLKRSTQSVPERLHRQLTVKFASLEFKIENGDAERGRTIFEGLVSAYPNRGDIWDTWLALEKRECATASSSDADKQAHIARVRDLLVRMSNLKMKKLRAKKFFENWIEWEESLPKRKGKDVEKVKTRAKEYVERMQRERDEREAAAAEGSDDE